jgi:hypothetical protein
MTVHLFVFVSHLIIGFEISVFQTSSQLQIFQKQRITEKLLQSRAVVGWHNFRLVLIGRACSDVRTSSSTAGTGSARSWSWRRKRWGKATLFPGGRTEAQAPGV